MPITWAWHHHTYDIMMGMTSSHIRYHDGHDIITYPISWRHHIPDIMAWHHIPDIMAWHHIRYHDIIYTGDIITLPPISLVKISSLNHLATKRYRIPCSKTKQQIDRQIVQPKGGSKMSFQVKTDIYICSMAWSCWSLAEASICLSRCDNKWCSGIWRLSIFKGELWEFYDALSLGCWFVWDCKQEYDSTTYANDYSTCWTTRSLGD